MQHESTDADSIRLRKSNGFPEHDSRLRRLPQRFSPPEGGIGVGDIPCKQRLSYKRYACARKCTFPRCLRLPPPWAALLQEEVSLILTPAGAALKRKASARYPIQSDKAALRRQGFRRSRLTAVRTAHSPNKGVTLTPCFHAVPVAQRGVGA